MLPHSIPTKFYCRISAGTPPYLTLYLYYMTIFMDSHTTPQIFQRELYIHFEQIAQSRGNTKTSCRITKQIWPKYDRNRTKDLLSKSRKRRYKFTAIITGHWSFAEHVLKMVLPYNNSCRSFKQEGNTERVFHFLCLR